MVPSTLITFVISSLVAVNGAIVHRDGHSAVANSTAPPSGTPSVPPSSTFPVSSGTVVVPPVTNSTSAVVPTMTNSTSPCVTPTVSYPTTIQTTSPTSSGTTTPSPAPSGGSANCNGVQQWQAAFAYTAGNRAIFNNQLYTAKQWTYNNSPPAHPDQWTADGVCSQPINNQANCNGIPAWQSTVAYNTGNQVTQNGHLWSAVQWTTSNSPGDDSGTWQDLGACA